MIAELETKTTARDLEAMLERHYLPEGRLPAGLFVSEIQSPDGRRRADALWCPWSTVGGISGLVGHEIKVSRSDLMVELLDPLKFEPWAKYCREWWLVVPHPALIDGLQIPATWGVMAPPSGRRRRSMTIVRPAPMLRPNETGLAWQRVTAWLAHRVGDKVRDAEWKASSAESRAERAEAELLDRRTAELGRVDQRAAKVGRILAELDKRQLPWRYGVEDDISGIVDAIADLEQVKRLDERLRDDLRWKADEARRLTEPAKGIAAELDRLAKTTAGAAA